MPAKKPVPAKKADKPASKARKPVPAPSPSKPDQAAREAAVKAENARVRQAVHGTAFLDPAAKGVQILSGKPMNVSKRPTIISKNTRNK